MKKIGFVGTHSTGKTTLATRITSVSEAVLVSEVARKFDKHLLRNCDTQIEIFLTQLSEELKLEESDAKLIVCDRTLIDNLAYLSFHM